MNRWMRSLQPWLCVGALLLLSACAFGDRKVTLSYQPESAADDSTAAQIEGTVARVYCTALFSYEAEVSFFATLRRDGKEVINQQYHGTGSAGVNMAATSGSYKDSLNRALAAALRSLIADLKIAGATT